MWYCTLHSLQVPGPGKDVWEYVVFNKNYAEIISTLATLQVASKIADKLRADGIIGSHVAKLARNYAPGVVEDDRVRPMIDVLKDKIQQNPKLYHQTRHILVSLLDRDADTVIYYLPEKGMYCCMFGSILCELTNQFTCSND